jgi:hypothetical protein
MTIKLHSDAEVVVFSGSESTRHFALDNNDFVRFENLEFVDGSAIGSGGSVSIENSTVSMSNMSFDSNATTYLTGEDHRGGAIWCHESTLTIDESQFSENACGVGAPNPNGPFDIFSFGGAIYCSSSSLTLTNGDDESFVNNEAISGEGGAICLFESEFLISNQHFMGNSSCWDGGAVKIGADDYEWLSPETSLQIFECNFEENSASYYGQNGQLAFGGGISSGTWSPGIIHAENVISIINTDFGNNGADRGGAISCSKTTIEMNEDTTIEYNVARSGGAMWSNGGVRVTGGTFSHNSTSPTEVDEGFGGAVFGFNPNCTTRFENVSFLNNSAIRRGPDFSDRFLSVNLASIRRESGKLWSRYGTTKTTQSQCSIQGQSGFGSFA